MAVISSIQYYIEQIKHGRLIVQNFQKSLKFCIDFLNKAKNEKQLQEAKESINLEYTEFNKNMIQQFESRLDYPPSVLAPAVVKKIEQTMVKAKDITNKLKVPANDSRGLNMHMGLCLSMVEEFSKLIQELE